MAARKPRRSPEMTPAQVKEARQLWLFVLADTGYIARRLGVTRAAVEGARIKGRWGYDPPSPDQQEDDHRFREALKLQQEAINREAFEASLAWLRFHRAAAARVADNADNPAELPMAGETGADSLLARLRNAPRFGETVTSGRMVTGQVTEKVETTGGDRYSEAMAALLGLGDDDAEDEAAPVKSDADDPVPVQDPGDQGD